VSGGRLTAAEFRRELLELCGRALPALRPTARTRTLSRKLWDPRPGLSDTVLSTRAPR
jgi:hypothetical protein